MPAAHLWPTTWRKRGRSARARPGRRAATPSRHPTTSCICNCTALFLSRAEFPSPPDSSARPPAPPDVLHASRAVLLALPAFNTLGEGFGLDSAFVKAARISRDEGLRCIWPPPPPSPLSPPSLPSALLPIHHLPHLPCNSPLAERLRQGLRFLRCKDSGKGAFGKGVSNRHMYAHGVCVHCGCASFHIRTQMRLSASCLLT